MPVPLLVALLAIPSPQSTPTDYLQWIEDPATSRWYGLTHKVSWYEGDAVATAQGGELVALGSAAEETWVRENVARLPADSCWIGLNDVAAEGQFVWSNGEPVNHVHWAPGQPNHTAGTDGVILDRTDGWSWDDVTATATNFHAIVERSARPLAGWSFPVARALPGWVLDIAAGDLNGDGIDDVAAPNFDGPTVSVLFGRADGTLGLPQSFPIPDTGSSWATAIGRFSGDAWPDIAVINGAYIHVLSGNGAGGFVHVGSVQTDDVNQRAVDAADLDGDGDDDLVSVRADSFQGLAVHLSYGDHVFQSATYVTSASSGSVAHGDFDADGDVDLVVTSTAHDARYMIFRNDGTGTFAAADSGPFGIYGGRPAVADFDRDGILDLALPALAGTRIAHGRGDCVFDLDGPTLGGAHLGWAEAADFDGDGHEDVVIASEQGAYLQVYLSRAPDVLPLVARLYYANWGTSVRALNLGGDSRPELVAADRNGELVATFRNLTLDCDENGIDDATDILVDPALDQDGDGILDGCALAGTGFCAGDGSGIACPCGPSQAGAPGHGCASSSTSGGRLRAFGFPSVALDSVVLDADGLPAASIGLFYQGDTAVGGGNGLPFGDGLRCAGGSVVRLAIRPIAGGEARFGHGVAGDPGVAAAGSLPASGGTRRYQLWYRDAAAFCTASTFNLTNGVRIDWLP